MDEHELTCGQEIAASAEVPNALAALMRHVVINLRAHAHWVGQETPNARLEHEGLLAVARGYEDVAAAAESLATLMQSMRALEATPHESTRSRIFTRLDAYEGAAATKARAAARNTRADGGTHLGRSSAGLNEFSALRPHHENSYFRTRTANHNHGYDGLF